MNSSPQAMSYSSIGGPNKPGDQKNFGPEKPVVDKADVSSSHAGDSIKVEDSGSRSSPASYGTQQAVQLGTPHEKMKKENDQDRGKASPVDHKHGSGGSGGEQRKSSRAKPGGTAESQGIYLQPQTHEITDEQLVNEVRGIYAGLVMVEKKCIEIDKQQSESPNKLSDLQWQALISLHRTLLHEHHDFFLASQHPSASRVLKRLPEKYAMPARMWRYGIHSFLELLRHRLPDSLEHTLTFLYLAYSMMTLLLESVPEFRETWIECLGDLAQYWMAVEDVDMRDREAWAGVARYWYHQAADKNQSVGRIQHHLAVLARPDMLQQLFYYTKSLVSVHPFPSAGESIMLLFHPLLSAPKPFNQPIVASAFVTAHGYLFTQSSSPTGLDVTGLVTQTREFLQHLDMYIGRLSAAFRLHGVYMSLSNFAAIFQYGAADAVIPSEFNQDAEQPADVNHTASEKWTPVENVDAVEEDFVKSRTEPSSLLIFYGSFLTFQTLSAILGHVGNKNVYPAVHTSLAFLWCMALNDTSMMHIEVAVPWQKITTFLNTLIRSETDLQPVASDDFPIIEEKKHIPEDFLIRGQLWSQQYYPKGFFEEAPTEDDGRSIEYPSLSITRTYRCLWLGARLAKVRLRFSAKKIDNGQNEEYANMPSSTAGSRIIQILRRSSRIHRLLRSWRISPNVSIPLRNPTTHNRMWKCHEAAISRLHIHTACGTSNNFLSNGNKKKSHFRLCKENSAHLHREVIR